MTSTSTLEDVSKAGYFDRPVNNNGTEIRTEDDDHLETDFQLKEARIRELEYQCEAYKSKEKDTSNLEAINASLERRLDILTQELVNRPHMQSKSPRSPEQSRSPTLEFKRRSTFPKLPILCPSVPESPTTLQKDSQLDDLPARFSPRRTETEPISPIRFRHQTLLDRPVPHRSQNSSPSHSRPNSLVFPPTFREAIWESPASSDVRDMSSRTPKPRRKFASGSNSLKPLVLPAKSNRQSLPLSAPTATTSYALPDSPPPSTRPSTAEAHKEALQALEGKPLPQRFSQFPINHDTIAREQTQAEPPPLIGLEPPSSAGTSTQNPAISANTLRTVQWLSWNHLEPRKTCEHCIEPPLRHQLRTWYRISIGLLMSFEIAARYGPETLVNLVKSHDGSVSQADAPLDSDNNGTNSKPKTTEQESARTSGTLDTHFDSGYAENG